MRTAEEVLARKEFTNEELESILLALIGHAQEIPNLETAITELTGAPSLEVSALNEYSPAARFGNDRYSKAEKDNLEDLIYKSLTKPTRIDKIKTKYKEFMVRHFEDDQTSEQRAYAFHILNSQKYLDRLRNDFIRFISSANLSPGENTGDYLNSLSAPELREFISKYKEGFERYAAERKVEWTVAELERSLIDFSDELVMDSEVGESKEVHKLEIFKRYTGISYLDEKISSFYIMPYDELSWQIFSDKSLENEWVHDGKKMRFINPAPVMRINLRDKDYMVISDNGWRNNAEDFDEWKERDLGQRTLVTSWVTSAVAALYPLSLLLIYPFVGESFPHQLPFTLTSLLLLPYISGMSREPLNEMAKGMAHNLAHLHKTLGDLGRYSDSSHVGPIKPLSFRTKKTEIMNELFPVSKSDDIMPSVNFFLESIHDSLDDPQVVEEFSGIFSRMAENYGFIAGMLETEKGAAYLDPKMKNFVRYYSADNVTYVANIDKENTMRIENPMQVVKYTHLPRINWVEPRKVYDPFDLHKHKSNLRKIFTFQNLYIPALIDHITKAFRGDDYRYLQLVEEAGKLCLDSDGRRLLKTIEANRVYRESEAIDFVKEYREAAGLGLSGWLPEYHASVIHMSLLNIGRSRINRDTPAPNADEVFSAATALYHMVQLKKLGIEGPKTQNGNTELENLFNQTKSFISKCYEHRPEEFYKSVPDFYI